MNQFLGKDGLTSTSANHISNIAKEMYEALETKMESIRLVSRDYTLAISGQSYRVENESRKEDLTSLAHDLSQVASLKSLIAWLREGIKAKEKMCSQESELEWLLDQVKEGRKELEEPVYKPGPSLKDILEDEPVERQYRYYALEARCATLGQFIHPDGHFANARKTYFDKQKNPTSISGVGQDAEINQYSSSFTPEEVDEQFFALQKEYRAVQAEFNALKADLEQTRSARRSALLQQYDDAQKAWIIARDAALLKRNAEVKALRIVIPEPLKGIYDKVAAVASAK